MKKIIIVCQKELSGLFRSPLAYVAVFVMAATFNLFFYFLIEGNRETSLKDVFQIVEFMLIFFIPLLTMKSFAEEKATGTMEFLMTTPTTNNQIVMGKYFSAAAFHTLIVVYCLLYYFILTMYARVDTTAALLGYFGIWIEGLMFVSVGVMCSSLTRNQILSALIAYIILFTLYFTVGFRDILTGQLKIIFDYLSMVNHSQNLFIGLLQISDLIYFISITLFCLALTRINIETRL